MKNKTTKKPVVKTTKKEVSKVKVVKPKTSKPKEVKVDVEETKEHNVVLVSSTLSNVEKQSYYKNVCKNTNENNIDNIVKYEDRFMELLENNDDSVNAFIYEEGDSKKVNIIGWINFIKK